jgi:hypothetical protein
MIPAILIFTLVLLVFWKTIFYGLCVDDVQLWKNSNKLRKIKNNPPAYTPELTASNPIQYLWWHFSYTRLKSKKLAHLFTLLFHAANSIMIYYAFGSNSVSFMAAVLFAVNPAGTQGSVWMSARGYSIATLTALLMWVFPAYAPILYFFNFAIAATNFNFILTPAMFILSDYWWYIFLIPAGALTFLWYYKKLIGPRWGGSTKIMTAFKPVKIILYFKTLGYYFLMGLMPFRLGIYHKFLYSYGLSDKDNKECHRIDGYFFLGLTVMSILICNIKNIYTDQAVFGLFWFVLFISQWCNVITIQQSIAERYIYLPLVGLMLMMSNLLAKIPVEDSGLYLQTIVTTAFFVYYLVRTIFHIPAYKDEMAQADSNIMNYPDLYSCYTWKGLLEKKAGHNFIALETWFKGWKLRKNDFRLNNNIAVMLTDMGHLKDAEAFLENAEKNIIPEQREAAMSFINAERERIKKIREELAARKSRIIRPDAAVPPPIPPVIDPGIKKGLI